MVISALFCIIALGGLLTPSMADPSTLVYHSIEYSDMEPESMLRPRSPSLINNIEAFIYSFIPLLHSEMPPCVIFRKALAAHRGIDYGIKVEGEVHFHPSFPHQDIYICLFWFVSSMLRSSLNIIIMKIISLHFHSSPN